MPRSFLVKKTKHSGYSKAATTALQLDISSQAASTPKTPPVLGSINGISVRLNNGKFIETCVEMCDCMWEYIGICIQRRREVRPVEYLTTRLRFNVYIRHSFVVEGAFVTWLYINTYRNTLKGHRLCVLRLLIFNVYRSCLCMWDRQNA